MEGGGHHTMVPIVYLPDSGMVMVTIVTIVTTIIKPSVNMYYMAPTLLLFAGVSWGGEGGCFADHHPPLV